MVATVLALSGVAVPHFFLGILLIEVFAASLRLLPPSGYIPPTEDLGANLRLMLMPALTLSTGITAVLMRHTRSSFLEVMQQEYVATARAKGLVADDKILCSERVRLNSAPRPPHIIHCNRRHKSLQ
jgi:peptide/nickel transport system permease protein